MNSIFDSSMSISLLLICILLGLFGQSLRTTIGFYKLISDPDKPFKDFFEWRKFLISLSLGGLIGALISLIYKLPLSNTDILGIISASYGGADFIEGLLVKKAPTIR